MWINLGLAAILAGGLAMSDAMTQDEAVALAKQTAAAQLKADAKVVEVIRAETVDWPDSSLGCPQPGMMYAQMIVPGFKVTVSVGGTTVAVHVGSGQAVICSSSKTRKTMD